MLRLLLAALVIAEAALVLWFTFKNLQGKLKQELKTYRTVRLIRFSFVTIILGMAMLACGIALRMNVF